MICLERVYKQEEITGRLSPLLLDKGKGVTLNNKGEKERDPFLGHEKREEYRKEKRECIKGEDAYNRHHGICACP